MLNKGAQQMSHRKIVTTMIVLLVFALGAWAQNSPPHHQLAASNMVDGAAHPELIPDSTAYRLYLVAVSTGQNPTEVERTHQRAHLMRAGLVETDLQILTSVLSDFRTKYDAFVADYNASAKADSTTDVHTLLKKLDDLVQSTRDAIGARLSAGGAAKLHAFVVSEKKNMKTTEGAE
jgi:hypothetical protein